MIKTHRNRGGWIFVSFDGVDVLTVKPMMRMVIREPFFDALTDTEKDASIAAGFKAAGFEPGITIRMF